MNWPLETNYTSVYSNQIRDEFWLVQITVPFMVLWNIFKATHYILEQAHCSLCNLANVKSFKLTFQLTVRKFPRAWRLTATIIIYATTKKQFGALTNLTENVFPNISQDTHECTLAVKMQSLQNYSQKLNTVFIMAIVHSTDAERDILNWGSSYTAFSKWQSR